jgi:hypothetical protein
MVAPARCTCGYTKFAVRVDRTPAVLAPRWRPVPPTGGLGSTPMGLTMGAASQGWGRFMVSVAKGVANTFCLKCLRVRRGTPVGGGTAMASFFEETFVKVVMSDVVEPSCMTARFVLQGGEVHEMPIQVLDEVPPLLGTALEVRETLPSGAVAAGRVYKVALPTVFASGLYHLVFVDHCLDTTQHIGSIPLFGQLDVHGRSGDVIAMFGDYRASLISTGIPNVSLAAALDLINSALQARAQLGQDLGGTPSAPRVIGLQGRAVQDQEPPDGARLVWSAANNRWEPKAP